MSFVAPAFEDILDRCIEEMQAGHSTIDECLANHPVDRERLEPLLHAAGRFQVSRAGGLTPEQRAAASLRMHNLIAAQPRAGRNRSSNRLANPLSLGRMRLWRRPALALASLLLLVAMLTGGIFAASANALPGEALYAAKRTVERLRLSISTSREDDGQLHMDFAGRRLEEAAQLWEKGKAEKVGPVLGVYTGEIQAALALLQEQSDLTEIEQDRIINLAILRLDAQETRLSAWLDQTTGLEREQILAALQAARDARQQMSDLLGNNIVVLPTRTATATTIAATGEGEPPSVTPLPPEATEGWSQAWSTVYPKPGDFLTRTPVLPARPTVAIDDGQSPRQWMQNLWPTLQALPTRWREALQTARPEITRPARTPSRPRERLP